MIGIVIQPIRLRLAAAPSIRQQYPPEHDFRSKNALLDQHRCCSIWSTSLLYFTHSSDTNAERGIYKQSIEKHRQNLQPCPGTRAHTSTITLFINVFCHTSYLILGHTSNLIHRIDPKYTVFIRKKKNTLTQTRCSYHSICGSIQVLFWLVANLISGETSALNGLKLVVLWTINYIAINSTLDGKTHPSRSRCDSSSQGQM